MKSRLWIKLLAFLFCGLDLASAKTKMAIPIKAREGLEAKAPLKPSTVLPSIPLESLRLDFPVEKVVLKNGMTFILHAQPSIPMVSYHTWFRVGAKDELPGESGLAHMFEHMMFKGTQKYPNKVFDRILQANGIMNNAFTTQDYTGYYEILPSSKLELIMDMESDRMQSLNLEDSEFQKEREVVLEERRMRYDNDPGGMIWETLSSLVFHGSPYGLPVIGTVKDIRAFSVEKMNAFYKKWYMPSNAVVVIVGDFDTNNIKYLIEKYYGSLPSGARPVHGAFPSNSTNQKGAPIKTKGVKFEVNSPELLWGWKTAKSGTNDNYALDLIASILGQGKSSFLFKKLVYEKQLALSVGTHQYSMQEDGMFLMEAVARPGVSARVLKEAVEVALQEKWKKSFTEQELAKAKNMILSDYVESLKTNDGKAKILAINEVMMGDYKEFFKDIEKYQKININDLERVRSYFNDKNKIFTFVSQKGTL